MTVTTASTIDRGRLSSLEQTGPVISWAAIFAGAAVACALSLLLLALGAGIGLSSVSPWGGNPTASRLGWAAGVYLVVTACLASTLGGYVAARFRTKWVGAHTDEVYMRDMAHGFVAWAVATLITATVLASASASIVGGVAQPVAMGAAQAAGNAATSEPMAAFADRLLRPGTAAPAGQPADAASSRSEVGRILTDSLSRGGDLNAGDRTYLAQVVAARTGLSQAEAEQRVAQTVDQAKAAVDAARRAGANLALWIAATLLMGAFAGSLGAIEAGRLRDDMPAMTA